jgi:cold shock CspA family protein
MPLACRGEVKHVDTSNAATVILIDSNNADSLFVRFSSVEFGDMVRCSRQAATGNTVNFARWPSWRVPVSA